MPSDRHSLRPLLEDLCRAVKAQSGNASVPTNAFAAEVFRPKAQLFQQGMTAKYLFALSVGYVKLTASLPDGRTQGLRLAAPWTLLGAEVLGDAVYRCSGHAVTDTYVLRIPHQALLRALDRDPNIALRVMALLKRDLCESMALVRDLGLKTAQERISSFLLGTAQEDGHVPLSRTLLAEMLGMTVETVSRTLSALRRDGVIEAPPNQPVRITDRDRLVQLTGD